MSKTATIVVLAACGLFTSAASAQATFVWCGGIPDGQWLNVKGVASDGSAIAGTANFPTSGGGTLGRTYRWTASTGIVNLGTLLPSSLANPYSDGYAISADGLVVVGRSYTTGDRGFRWSGGTMTELPVLAGATYAGATALSSDGSLATGWCGGHAVRWSAAGVEDLGTCPFRPYATPWAASADAAVIAGVASSAAGNDDRAFVLDISGWTDLGVFPGDPYSRAYTMSADGSVVAGYSKGTAFSVSHPFRWTRAGGLEPLPLLSPATGATPLGVSGDGNVIVGTVTNPSNPNADGFVWTRVEGTRSVREVLTSYGVDLTGVIAVSAQAVSADGRTLAGVAGGPNQYRAWVARLPRGFGCYPNCDGSAADPALNFADFSCFLRRFAAGDPYANCDASTVPPVLNVEDFICFLQRFAAGCP